MFIRPAFESSSLLAASRITVISIFNEEKWPMTPTVNESTKVFHFKYLRFSHRWGTSSAYYDLTQISLPNAHCKNSSKNELVKELSGLQPVPATFLAIAEEVGEQVAALLAVVKSEALLRFYAPLFFSPNGVIGADALTAINSFPKGFDNITDFFSRTCLGRLVWLIQAI